jgi:4'-phosphopantetheinyl transferase
MNLNYNTIHISKCLLNQPEEVITGIFSLLSDAEKIKAEKIKLPQVKNRWIVSRGVLRLLLSNYCSCSTKEIEFNFNEFGKPLLSNNPEISFNLSHSENLALYIFTHNRKVGIDLEKIGELTDIDGLSRLCFSDHEKKWFNKFSPAEKKELFYKIWTCKEAYIKAIGKGFSFSPVNITLDMSSDKEIYFKEIIGDDDFRKWNIVKINAHPDFISTALIEGDDFVVEQYKLNLFIDKSKSLSSDSAISYSIEKT